jgi:transposase-like protein
VNVRALLATGVNAADCWEILGLHVTTSEDGADWLAFFRDRERGAHCRRRGNFFLEIRKIISGITEQFR